MLVIVKKKTSNHHQISYICTEFMTNISLCRLYRSLYTQWTHKKEKQIRKKYQITLKIVEHINNRQLKSNGSLKFSLDIIEQTL